MSDFTDSTAPAAEAAAYAILASQPALDLETLHARNKLFVSGPFGSGKTTLAIERIRWLLAQERVRGDDILVVVPQRTFALPFYDALRSPTMPPGPPPRITTLAGLARNAVELYWPLLAQNAGFRDPGREPTFLNLETAQFYMGQFVEEAIQNAAFDGIRIDPNRVVSQVLDNLNKAALHSFSIEQAYQRLELAVPPGEGQTARLNALRAARTISQQFRDLCRARSLVDFSLQIRLLGEYVLQNEWSRTHFFRQYRHLVADNVEENNAVAHQLMGQWLPTLDSALIAKDDDGGYRLFLGANPDGAVKLAEACDVYVSLAHAPDTSPALLALARRINHLITGRTATHDGYVDPFGGEGNGEGSDGSGDSIEDVPTNDLDTADVRGTSTASSINDAGFAFSDHAILAKSGNLLTGTAAQPLILPDREFRFYPQMIDWTVGEIDRLIRDDGVEPGQIAVLAPFVSDALRFSLQTGLAARGIDSTTHRPSRALADEPATRTLLTLAALAHPAWGIRPAESDVALALALTVDGLDPVRAHLLTRIVYPARRRTIELGRFEELIPEMQRRIGYAVGERFDRLREWIYSYRAGEGEAQKVTVDQFFARIFGEMVSQPGYGFHEEYDGARVANQLVESARNFRWALEDVEQGDAPRSVMLGRAYFRLIESGAIGALYVPGWREAEDAVFIAPAYTFLMRNRAVDVQFWLDIGSTGWWERLYQPLTHPYVLSAHWPAGKPWTDFDEYTTRQETMRRLLLGLIRRARRTVHVGISSYSESGFEQTGPLLNLMNRLLVQERN